MDFINQTFSVGPGFNLTPLLIVLFIWSIFWKGIALWHSSKLNKPYWFIAILLINTTGILEILYLFVFAKPKFDLRAFFENLTKSKK